MASGNWQTAVLSNFFWALENNYVLTPVAAVVLVFRILTVTFFNIYWLNILYCRSCQCTHTSVGYCHF